MRSDEQMLEAIQACEQYSNDKHCPRRNFLCGEKVRPELISEITGDTQETQTRKLEKLMALLRELGENKFFGKLLIEYKSGHIVQVRKTQNIRLSAQHER